MPIPRIRFGYSRIYDRQFVNWRKVYGNARARAVQKWFASLGSTRYPSPDETSSFCSVLESLWGQRGKAILGELSRITRLKWEEADIPCYVVGRCIPFSNPLTIPVFEKQPDYAIDMMIHELIHRLFSQDGNERRCGRAWRYIDANYRSESAITRAHIPVHAVHAHIFLKFFGEARLRREIALMRFFPRYRRSWAIVEKHSHQKIVEEFAKRVD